MFLRVAEAEAKLHGVPIETVHFHEVGAVDSIVDLVCAAVGIHYLKLENITASVPVDGTGSIQCAHGTFPLPAPATAEILRGIPIRQLDVPHELTTPTGAAILAHFVKKFGSLDSFAADKIGYGLGTRELPGRPNVLRAFLGTPSTTPHTIPSWKYVLTSTISLASTSPTPLTASWPTAPSTLPPSPSS